MSRLGLLIRFGRRRRPRALNVRVREPSLGADADVRVAVSPQLAVEAGWDRAGPAPGLLSGDGLVLPETISAETAGRVLDAIAPSAPRDFTSVAALVAAARVAFGVYMARRAQHEAVAGQETDAVLNAAGYGHSSGDGERSGTERFTAARMDFADWRALHEAPLHLALRWLGARGVQQRMDSEKQ